MSDAIPAPQPEPALVVGRWNSWALVHFPSTGTSRWIDLERVEYEILDGPPLGAASPSPRPDAEIAGAPESAG